MDYNLDKKDVKILFNLFEDARMSLGQIGKETGLSKNSVKNRIERLQERQIIEGFSTIVNHGILGFNSFMLLIEFNDDIYENLEIQKYFTKHRFTNWVSVLSGKWDLLVEFIVRDFDEQSDIIENFIEKFGELVNNYKIYSSNILIRIEHLAEDIYKDIDVKKKIIKNIKPNNNIKLDEIDKKILHHLSKNSVENYVIMSHKLNLTVDIVKYRVKKLKESGIITKFIPLLETSKLGYTEYLYVFNLRNSSKEKLEAFKNKIKNHPNVLYSFFDIINFSIIVSPTFKKTTDMDEFSRKIKKEFGEIIKSQDYFMISDNLYFNLFPDGLLK